MTMPSPVSEPIKAFPFVGAQQHVSLPTLNYQGSLPCREIMSDPMPGFSVAYLLEKKSPGDYFVGLKAAGRNGTVTVVLPHAHRQVVQALCRQLHAAAAARRPDA